MNCPWYELSLRPSNASSSQVVVDLITNEQDHALLGPRPRHDELELERNGREREERLKEGLRPLPHPDPRGAASTKTRRKSR
ncbi:hypothetical protein L596_005648 [Steinernema carpocapsae]|uniref:Uncharacterized protein n=1 Tax=Steinernema carpocapsae TaxID=34508 RepID=A0A4U8UZR9_STECR|nr:hypothetical protein L596_005648 [Steinernema carpocapsae]